MSKTISKSTQAFIVLQCHFGSNSFTFDEAQALLASSCGFTRQLLGAMKRAKLITENGATLTLAENGLNTIMNSANAISSDWTQDHRRTFICKQDPSKCGVGDFFTKEDLSGINAFYRKWKRDSEECLWYGCRRLNLPEVLTEGLASALLNMPRTNNSLLSNIEGSADLVDVETGMEIQIKGVSTKDEEDGGPTTFGPQTKFSRLIVVHVCLKEDKAYFYELDANEYKTWPVSKKETIEDQQEDGKRPRVTILPIIKAKGLTPFITYSFETGEIE